MLFYICLSVRTLLRWRQNLPKICTLFCLVLIKILNSVLFHFLYWHIKTLEQSVENVSSRTPVFFLPEVHLRWADTYLYQKVFDALFRRSDSKVDGLWLCFIITFCVCLWRYLFNAEKNKQQQQQTSNVREVGKIGFYILSYCFLLLFLFCIEWE